MLVAEVTVDKGVAVATGDVALTLEAAPAVGLVTPVGAPGWDPRSEAVALDDARALVQVTMPTSFVASGVLCVELLAFLSSPSSTVELLEWASAGMKLELEPSGYPGLTATTGSLTLPLPAAAPESAPIAGAAPAGRWSALAIVRTDTTLTFVIDGVVVMRRVTDAPASLLPAGGALLLKGSDAPHQIAGVRVSADVPEHLHTPLAIADKAGLAAIASRWLERQADLGAPTGAAVIVGDGLLQTCATGVIAWTEKTGARVLTDAQLIASWTSAGGPGGSLGWPTADEAGDDGQPGPDVKTLLDYRFAAFTGGAIYRIRSGATIQIPEPFLLEYWNHGGARGLLGLPNEGEHAATPGTGRIGFDLGAIYKHGEGRDAVITVPGELEDEYQRLGSASGWLGAPVSRESADGPTRTQDFEGGTLWVVPGRGGHALPSDWADVYRRQYGAAAGELGPPVGDWHDGPDAYCETKNGILASPSGYPITGLTAIELTLDSIHTHDIDDGGWPVHDGDAEVYCYVTVTIDGKVVEDHRRDPASGYGDKSVDLDHRPYTVPLARHDSTIILDIDVWDWDGGLKGDDDPLGHHHAQFTLSNLWGHGTPFSEPITNAYADANNNPDTIHLNYTCGRPSIPDDPSAPWRSQHWWSFPNFDTEHLPRDLFEESFEDVASVDGVVGQVLHPLDTFYFDAFYAGSAKDGNCFGLSALADVAMRRPSLLREPLTDLYRATKISSPMDENDVPAGLRRLINAWHGAQLSSTMVSAALAQILNPGWHASDAIDLGIATLNANRRAIFSMQRRDFSGGHSVLAYRATAPADPRGVWVGDPNAEWESTDMPKDPDGTFLHLTGAGWEIDSLHHQPFFSGYRNDLLSVFPQGLFEPPWRTPLPELGWNVQTALSALVLLGGAATAEGLIVDGHLMTGAVSGPLYKWELSKGTAQPLMRDELPPPGFAIIPIPGADQRSLFAAGTGYVPDEVRIQVRATNNEDYHLFLRTGAGIVHVRAYAGDGFRDEFAISGLRSGRPRLQCASTHQKTIELHLGRFTDAGPEVVRVAGTMEPGAPLYVGHAEFASAWDMRVDGPAPVYAIEFGAALDDLVAYPAPDVPPSAMVRFHPEIAPGQRNVSIRTPAAAGLFEQMVVLDRI
jgi:hypothetical protein